MEKDEKEAGIGPFLKNILMEIIALETFFGGGIKSFITWDKQNAY